MKEISLNILDIAENSTKAGASLVTIDVAADTAADTLTVVIDDDGCGMEEEFLKRVQDPFTTTRTTRPVGLGIPLFKEAAETAGGRFEIRSQVGVGTTVTAVFGLENIDRMPLGDMASTMTTLIQCHENCDFVFNYKLDENEFVLDTRQLKEILGDVPLTSAEIVLWIRDFISDNMRIINGGRSI